MLVGWLWTLLVERLWALLVGWSGLLLVGWLWALLVGWLWALLVLESFLRDLVCWRVNIDCSDRESSLLG